MSPGEQKPAAALRFPLPSPLQPQLGAGEPHAGPRIPPLDMWLVSVGGRGEGWGERLDIPSKDTSELPTKLPEAVPILAAIYRDRGAKGRHSVLPQSMFTGTNVVEDVPPVPGL